MLFVVSIGTQVCPDSYRRKIYSKGEFQPGTSASLCWVLQGQQPEGHSHGRGLGGAARGVGGPCTTPGTAESLRGDLERGVAVQAVSVPTLLRHLSLSDSTLPLSSPGTLIPRGRVPGLLWAPSSRLWEQREHSLQDGGGAGTGSASGWELCLY